MKPYFILLVGIPGSGKSRWANEILCCLQLVRGHWHPNADTQIVCPDEIRRELGDSVSDQLINMEVWLKAKQEVIWLLKSGKNVILDATNVNTLYRKIFMDDLPECTLIAKLFAIEPEVAYERIQKDLENKDRADVPEHVVYKMYGEFLYTARYIKNEGFEVTLIDIDFPDDWEKDIIESKKRFGR